MKRQGPGVARHRILVILAERGRTAPIRHRALREVLELRSAGTVHAHLTHLIRDGLVETTPAGYRLSMGIAVGRNGYVGRMHRTFS